MYRSDFDTQVSGWPSMRHDTSNLQTEDPWDIILGVGDRFTMPSTERRYHTWLIASKLKGDVMTTPQQLDGLELYESDGKFVAKFDKTYTRWVRTYPRIDVAAEIFKAHTWEMDNPSKRKKDRVRFIGAWLSRLAAKLPPQAPEHTISTEEEINILITEYKIANPKMSEDEARVFAERAVSRGQA